MKDETTPFAEELEHTRAYLAVEQAQFGSKLFGPQSYHEDDYAIYYNNVKDSVAKRVATYKASL